ncbi:SMP-30/gluconolactonase/LRE family protein [Burkholderia sp. 3C]
MNESAIKPRNRLCYARKLTIGAALLAASLIADIAAAADLRFTAHQLYPESVTWSARQQVFMVGSVQHGTVGRLTPDGHYTAFIRDPRLISTLGLLVDDRRNTLWVTNSDPGVGEHTSATTNGKLAAVATYDASTGKPRAYFDLSRLEPGVHLANDLVLDAHGNAYVTDSFAPVIFRIDTEGKVSVFARDARFWTREGFNLNGIAIHPDGYLLVGNSNSGELFRIDLDDPSKISPVKLPETLIGADGFDLIDAHHLIVVQNAGIDRTVELVSTDGWQSATILRTQKSKESKPTAAVTKDGTVYVLNSRLDTLPDPKAPKVDRYLLQPF